MYYKIVNKRKRILTSLVDHFGYALWKTGRILRENRDEPPPASVKEILVIRTAYVGDVVMTLPILRPLKELYPGAKITLLTSSKAAGILENHPDIDRVLIYDAFWFYPETIGKAIKDYMSILKVLRNHCYDLAIETRADIRDIAFLLYLSKSKHRVSYNVGGGGYLLTHTVPFLETKHRVEYHMDIIRFLGWNGKEMEWNLTLTPQATKSASAMLSDQGIMDTDFVVGIHPGGRKELKCWPSDRYAAVADGIIQRWHGKVVFTGSHGEQGLIENILAKMNSKAINLAGKTDLQALAGLVKRYGLFICNDSAPLHIASALKTPTIAIFGPSKSLETGPYGNLHRVVEKDFPCRFECDESHCYLKSYNQCMNTISTVDVLDAISSLLAYAEH